MKILRFPLTKITLCFILGILFYQKQPAGSLLLLSYTGCGISGLALCHYLSKKRNIYQHLFNLFVPVVSFGIGLSTATIHNDLLRDNHYTHSVIEGSSTETSLTIHEKLKDSGKNLRYVATVSSINATECRGKIILNIRKPVQTNNLPIGAQLAVVGSIYRNKSPANPNQFDYSKYLENQQIYAQLYTDELKIRRIGMESGIWSAFSNFRNRIIQNLERSQFRQAELNILIALLLGQQQDISPEILKGYQLAGAVHILSVSGLHVGFILLFVTFLLKPISNSKRNTIIKLGVVLLSLWSYGLLAGLAPSVVRSVTMFSFVAVGNHLKRTINSFHTLLVSMLLILLWKPSFLFDVGFQLSYLALFFILWLQPLLSAIWHPKNKILQYFWDIVTVSFAAQIGTMPLSIYYFHQFPGLFFITNILVLPLLAVIMIVGLVAIVMACIGKVPFLLTKPLEFLIDLQNNIIVWIASFDEFVLRNISFTISMLWVSYLVIITFILWIGRPKFKPLAVAMGLLLLLQCLYVFTEFETTQTKEMIVFHAREHTIITERYNNRVNVYSNDSLLNTLENNITVQSYLTGNFCKIQKTKRMQNLYFFDGKKILVIDSCSVYAKNLQPDIVIICNSPKLNMARMLSVMKPKQIIVDGSNYKSYVALWAATCRKEKIPFHSTSEKGFYKI